MGSAPQSSAAAQSKMMRILAAEEGLRRGQALLRKNEFVPAIRELERAVAGNPEDGDPLALLAWARLCAGQSNPTDTRAVLSQAIRLSPRSAIAHYHLGLCLKNDGETDRALASFKRALELDERLIEAEREVRLINMRKDKDKGGLFDRFRKPTR
jgi:tetratricopeptide (TPR) repeat protein